MSNIKETCFGFKDGECKVLTKTNCANCNFYKTKSQVLEGRIKALKRLNRAPRSYYYTEKYYDGSAPNYKEEEQ